MAVYKLQAQKVLLRYRPSTKKAAIFDALKMDGRADGNQKNKKCFPENRVSIKYMINHFGISFFRATPEEVECQLSSLAGPHMGIRRHYDWVPLGESSLGLLSVTSPRAGERPRVEIAPALPHTSPKPEAGTTPCPCVCCPEKL